MSVYLLYSLIFGYEVYYVMHYASVARIFLYVKIGILILCALFASTQLKSRIRYVAGLDAILIVFYIVLIFASSIFSINPIYVIIYGLMFCALILFIYVCSVDLVVNDRYDVLRFIPILFSVLIIISVFGYLVRISDFFYVDVWGNTRVNGLFGEPSRLAQISVLNIFFLYHFFRKRFWWWSVLTLLSLIAIFVAGNRSYMFALICIVYMHTVRKFFNTKIAKIAFILFSGVAILAITLLFKDNLAHFKYLRIESISTLSGRTEMWQKVLPVAVKKPFGSGYILGGTDLVEVSKNVRISLRNRKDFSLLSPGLYKSTLHNGYLQSLCDLGPIGFIIYIIIFSRGLYFVYKSRDVSGRVLFVNIILFFTIVNFSATILVSPTENNTVLFWLAWFVLSLSNFKINKSYQNLNYAEK